MQLEPFGLNVLQIFIHIAILYRNRSGASFSRLSRVLWTLDLRKTEIYELKFREAICIMDLYGFFQRFDEAFDLYNVTRAKFRIDTIFDFPRLTYAYVELVRFIMCLFDLDLFL